MANSKVKATHNLSAFLQYPVLKLSKTDNFFSIFFDFICYFKSWQHCMNETLKHFLFIDRPDPTGNGGSSNTAKTAKAFFHPKIREKVLTLYKVRES